MQYMHIYIEVVVKNKGIHRYTYISVYIYIYIFIKCVYVSKVLNIISKKTWTYIKKNKLCWDIIYADVVPGLVLSVKFISGVCPLGNLQVDVVQDFVLGMIYRYVHLHI